MGNPSNLKAEAGVHGRKNISLLERFYPMRIFTLLAVIFIFGACRKTSQQLSSSLPDRIKRIEHIDPNDGQIFLSWELEYDSLFKIYSQNGVLIQYDHDSIVMQGLIDLDRVKYHINDQNLADTIIRGNYFDYIMSKEVVTYNNKSQKESVKRYNENNNYYGWTDYTYDNYGNNTGSVSYLNNGLMYELTTNFFDTTHNTTISEEDLGMPFLGKLDEHVISMRVHAFRSSNDFLRDTTWYTYYYNNKTQIERVETKRRYSSGSIEYGVTKYYYY